MAVAALNVRLHARTTRVPARELGCWLATTLLCLTLSACAAAAPQHGVQSRASALVAGEQACGPASAQAAAAAAAMVARRIYDQEVSSAGVSADRLQVERYGPLLRALVDGRRAAVAEAVHSLVYSHTHIVRLRVSSGGALLADIGGPYILAPVSGRLRVGGRTVGGYVFSVQDDSGYVKQESRLVGLPLILRRGPRRVPLEGTLPASSAGIAASGPVSYAGRRYEAVSFAAEAFPTGSLQITILDPLARPSALGCNAIELDELARIGKRVWQRFTSVGASAGSYVKSLHDLTGALAYVRAGRRQLAGSTTPGPALLPDSAAVSFRGLSYQVRSFPARLRGGRVRVYQLLAP